MLRNHLLLHTIIRVPDNGGNPSAPTVCFSLRLGSDLPSAYSAPGFHPAPALCHPFCGRTLFFIVFSYTLVLIIRKRLQKVKVLTVFSERRFCSRCKSLSQPITNVSFFWSKRHIPWRNRFSRKPLPGTYIFFLLLSLTL